MRLHRNAALTPNKRLVLSRRVIDEGWTLSEAAEVSVPTARKWARRLIAEGEPGLIDRSSAPDTQAGATPEDRIQAIAALRRVRLTGAEIAGVLEMAHSTVSGILTRIGLGKLSRLEPREPANRYERRTPGDLLHIDVKKLGRIGHRGPGHRVTGTRKGHRSKGAGWEFCHVCVDDATRLAYVEVLCDEKAKTAVGFLSRAIAFYRSHGVEVREVMTDNGSAYISIAHRLACKTLGVRHIRIRPGRPQTNGKAERFIRTMLGGWAYGAIYASSADRSAALSGWLRFYNWDRPHRSLGRRPPGDRLFELNNVVGSYS